MNSEELKEVLRLHNIWLADRSAGNRANLADADLADADLKRANLIDADLAGANLEDANLRGANLTGANLKFADLADADLADADLKRANLADANLAGANLKRANLADADLEGANLTDVKWGYPVPSEAEQKSNLAKIAKMILLDDSPFDMSDWGKNEPCGTACCIGGHAEMYIPTPFPKEWPTYLIGRLLLGDEAATKFYTGNENAKEYLKKFLK